MAPGCVALLVLPANLDAVYDDHAGCGSVDDDDDDDYDDVDADLP